MPCASSASLIISPSRRVCTSSSVAQLFSDMLHLLTNRYGLSQVMNRFSESKHGYCTVTGSALQLFTCAPGYGYLVPARSFCAVQGGICRTQYIVRLLTVIGENGYAQ